MQNGLPPREEMAMDSKTGGQFEVRQEMRAFAEKVFDQARKAFETFISTARHTVNVLEGQARGRNEGFESLTGLVEALLRKRSHLLRNFELPTCLAIHRHL